MEQAMCDVQQLARCDAQPVDLLGERLEVAPRGFVRADVLRRPPAPSRKSVT
jgi:hypothetical protein